MSNPLVYESVQPHNTSARSRTVKLLRIFCTWIARRRQRHALGDLAEFNRHLLKDIGLSHEEAQREAAKWFWQG